MLITKKRIACDPLLVGSLMYSQTPYFLLRSIRYSIIMSFKEEEEVSNVYFTESGRLCAIHSLTVMARRRPLFPILT